MWSPRLFCSVLGRRAEAHRGWALSCSLTMRRCRGVRALIPGVHLVCNQPIYNESYLNASSIPLVSRSLRYLEETKGGSEGRSDRVLCKRHIPNPTPPQVSSHAKIMSVRGYFSTVPPKLFRKSLTCTTSHLTETTASGGEAIQRLGGGDVEESLLASAALRSDVVHVALEFDAPDVLTVAVVAAERDRGAGHVRRRVEELRVLVEHACETLARGRAVGGGEGQALSLHAAARAPRLGRRGRGVGYVNGGDGGERAVEIGRVKMLAVVRRVGLSVEADVVGVEAGRGVGLVAEAAHGLRVPGRCSGDE